MDKRAADFVLTLVLICAVGYLLYLDWLRQGELELLADEVANLKPKPAATTRKRKVEE